ncbi:hypothetical protein AB8O64_36355 (plasmid) [Streptomyces sp. QH1-20]|uniref:hypothetical protein n=1 Tax=Streptomyces sp. QH1-20 TaxID=3240934 RepID=UPI0035178C65
MGIFGRGSGQSAGEPGPVIGRAVPPAPAQFAKTEVVGEGDWVVLRWDTALGGIGLAYWLRDSNGQPKSVARALAARHGEHLGKVYCAVAIGRAAWNLTGPELAACDISPDGRTSTTYHPTWEDLERLLGVKAPYWPATLRDVDAITAWQPGAAPAQVPACHVVNPTAALTELAAAEPDGSPAAAVCWWLAREIRRRDYAQATRAIADISEAAAEGGDSAHLVLGAVPAPYLRDEHEEPEPEETVRRAGWLSITARRDTLAYRAAQAVWRYDGGDDWHAGELVHVRPTVCQIAAEWAARLKPAPTGQPPTVLEHDLLANVNTTTLFHDPGTLLPAALDAGTDGDEDDPDALHTLVPQRLPTTGQLEKVHLSDDNVWIRTAADPESGLPAGLWLAPQRPGAGLGYGYSGGGPHTLAQLLDQLLDDITTPAVDHGRPQPPDGLFHLISTAPQDRASTFTRAQLLAARAR